MEPVIIFENVYKTYPLYHHITGGIKNFIFNLPKGLESIRNSKYVALHDISFEVFKGETLGIIGKNGAGKSTILGLIAGVLKPTRQNYQRENLAIARAGCWVSSRIDRERKYNA